MRCCDLSNEIDRCEASLSNELNKTPCFLSSGKLTNFKKEIRSQIQNLDMLIFKREALVHSQFRDIARDKSMVKELIDKIREYDTTDPSREPGKYVSLQREIKNKFDSLADKDFSMQHYLSDVDMTSSHHIHEDETQTKGQPLRMKNTPQNMEKIVSNRTSKTKKTKETKERKSLPTKRKAQVPFLTREECKSRAVSKSTYINKDELIKTIERLGMAKHFQNPLNSYTKDQLCDGYFMYSDLKI